MVVSRFACQGKFEALEYWRRSVPTGVKIDLQGRYYVSVPRLAPGVPATMNRLALHDGRRCSRPFLAWDWNEAGT